MAYDTNQSKVTQEEFEYSREMIGKLAQYFENVVVGQKELETSLLTAILADGHVLIESVPDLRRPPQPRLSPKRLTVSFPGSSALRTFFPEIS